MSVFSGFFFYFYRVLGRFSAIGAQKHHTQKSFLSRFSAFLGEGSSKTRQKICIGKKNKKPNPGPRSFFGL
jgi:hypothetical protein